MQAAQFNNPAMMNGMDYRNHNIMQQRQSMNAMEQRRSSHKSNVSAMNGNIHPPSGNFKQTSGPQIVPQPS